MTMTPPSISAPIYSEQDHHTWAALYARQLPQAEQRGCRLFRDGLQRLRLDPQRLPDPCDVSDRLFELSGWTLGDAQNAYLGPTEWFEHIAERRFPVTNYIRQPHEIDFTPLPDLFHEYFGHLAFFTDRRFGDIAQAFGPLYLAADERQRLEIARLWWFTTEFGLLYEDGELRALGAGLLSSIGEMQKAFAPATQRIPFAIRRAAETASAVYEMHQIYFILDGVEQIVAIIRQYATDEGLPIPAL
ncbi:amino acid hydroxylase [Candidatus Gracilibacteria bacterium]|nr:amino acid hydroxylase [Candidatus Gracilibacteria bacterium]